MKKRRILALGLAACLAITSLAAPVYAADETTAAVTATASKSYKITKRNIPTYFFEYKSEDNRKIPLYYMNGTDVPYFEITDMVSAYITILKQCGRPEFDLEVKKEDFGEDGDKYFDAISKVPVWPVLNIRFTYRIF